MNGVINVKKCLHCGEECEDKVSICPKCGAMVDSYVDHKTYMNVYHINQGKRIKNKKLILWFLLGFILPYIGFFVSWIMYDGERDRAKAVLLGAIVSTVLTTLLSYLLPLFFVGEEPGEEGLDDDRGQQMRNLIELYRSL